MEYMRSVKERRAHTVIDHRQGSQTSNDLLTTKKTSCNILGEVCQECGIMMKYFCVSCKEPICMNCSYFSSHQGHIILESRKVLEIFIERHQQLKTTTKSLTKGLKTVVDRFKIKESKLNCEAEKEVRGEVSEGGISSINSPRPSLDLKKFLRGIIVAEINKATTSHLDQIQKLADYLQDMARLMETKKQKMIHSLDDFMVRSSFKGDNFLGEFEALKAMNHSLKKEIFSSINEKTEIKVVPEGYRKIFEIPELDGCQNHEEVKELIFSHLRGFEAKVDDMTAKSGLVILKLKSFFDKEVAGLQIGSPGFNQAPQHQSIPSLEKIGSFMKDLLSHWENSRSASRGLVEGLENALKLEKNQFLFDDQLLGVPSNENPLDLHQSKIFSVTNQFYPSNYQSNPCPRSTTDGTAAMSSSNIFAAQPKTLLEDTINFDDFVSGVEISQKENLFVDSELIIRNQALHEENNPDRFDEEPHLRLDRDIGDNTLKNINSFLDGDEEIVETLSSLNESEKKAHKKLWGSTAHIGAKISSINEFTCQEKKTNSRPVNAVGSYRLKNQFSQLEPVRKNFGRQATGEKILRPRNAYNNRMSLNFSQRSSMRSRELHKSPRFLTPILKRKGVHLKTGPSEKKMRTVKQFETQRTPRARKERIGDKKKGFNQPRKSQMPVKKIQEFVLGVVSKSIPQKMKSLFYSVDEKGKNLVASMSKKFENSPDIVDLHGCGVTDQLLVCLIPRIHCLKAHQTINLRNNHVTDLGLQVMLMIISCFAFDSLDMRENPISLGCIFKFNQVLSSSSTPLSLSGAARFSVNEEERAQVRGKLHPSIILE